MVGVEQQLCSSFICSVIGGPCLECGMWSSKLLLSIGGGVTAEGQEKIGSPSRSIYTGATHRVVMAARGFTHPSMRGVRGHVPRRLLLIRSVWLK